jgi:lactoylglutathione lyase
LIEAVGGRERELRLMNTARVNLVVLRVADIDRAAAFYALLGVAFSKHAHGNGPMHYAAECGGVVFELYPATEEQAVSSSARIGFAVGDVDDVAAKLGAVAGARLVTAPKDSEWGRRAVVADPDGHRVELVAGGGGA